MTATACAQVREVAAELALGIAAGHERAGALDHLATCPACREVVDHLTATADSLILVAPEAEPPVGFESRVLDQLDPRPPEPRHRTRTRTRARRVLVAAALVVAMLAIGAVLGRWSTDGTFGSGTEVATGALTAGDGATVGRVFAYPGEPSWILVTFPDAPAPPGSYVVLCLDAEGDSYTAGTLTIDAGHPVSSWSARVDDPLEDLTHVRLVNRDGGPDLVAPVGR